MIKGSERKYAEARNKMLMLEAELLCIHRKYPDYFKKVVKLFLEFSTEPLLPSEILLHPDFENTFSGEQYYYGNDSGHILGCNLFLCGVSPNDGVLRQCYVMTSRVGVCNYEKKAIAAYVHFCRGDYVRSLSMAKYALMDAWIDNADFKVKSLYFGCSIDSDFAELAEGMSRITTFIKAAMDYMKWEIQVQSVTWQKPCGARV